MPYGSQAEYDRRLAEAERQGKRVVFQHVHAPGERPAAQYWVPAELMSYLNDKSHLPELTPSEFVPPRRLVPPSDLPRLIRETPELPLVVKGSWPAVERRRELRGDRSPARGFARRAGSVWRPAPTSWLNNTWKPWATTA